MRYYRFMRNLHMWLGVILSIVLLTEGITGVMLAEPGIVGGGGKPNQQQLSESNPRTTGGQDTAAAPRSSAASGDAQSGDAARAARGQASSLQTTARRLHEGQIGSFNLRWLIALSGLGLTLLTLSGLYLAAAHLRRK